MKQVLVCGKCHCDITRELFIEYGSVESGWEQDGFPPSAVEEGLAIRHLTKVWRQEEETFQLNLTVWINLSDIIIDMSFVGEDIGCCGLTGIMSNRGCECGVSIGAEYSDCGELHRFEPNIKTTFWMPFIPHNKTRDRKRAERMAADKRSVKLFTEQE